VKGREHHAGTELYENHGLFSCGIEIWKL